MSTLRPPNSASLSSKSMGIDDIPNVTISPRVIQPIISGAVQNPHDSKAVPYLVLRVAPVPT